MMPLINTYQFQSAIVLVGIYFFSTVMCESVLGNSSMGEFETQNRTSIKNSNFSYTPITGSKFSIQNITSSRQSQYHDVMKLLKSVQQNNADPNHFTHIPKFWSVVHKINDTTTERALHNGIVTYAIDDNDNEFDEVLNTEHSNHKSKKKRDVVEGSIPCYLCKDSTDVFSNMISLNLIEPNDTGILPFSKVLNKKLIVLSRKIFL